jgi:hypothetical protein
MMRSQIMMAATILVLLAVPALAQQEVGDTELQAQATLSIATSGDQDDTGTVLLNVGRFFTVRQEAGLSVFGILVGGDLVGYGGPFYRYNFSNSNVVPYVGAAAAATFGDFGAGDSAVLTFEGGARFFLNRSTALSASARTEYSIDEQEFGDSLQLVFGFSHLWGR